MIGVFFFWTMLCGWYFQKKLGGVTGDVLGAVIETGEGWGLLYLSGVSPYV
ncbi:MAG: adenosylcobinamide-GDP ribazoletransferase [Thermodesulfobacteriota bacterium]